MGLYSLIWFQQQVFPSKMLLQQKRENWGREWKLPSSSDHHLPSLIWMTGGHIIFTPTCSQPGCSLSLRYSSIRALLQRHCYISCILGMFRLDQDPKSILKVSDSFSQSLTNQHIFENYFNRNSHSIIRPLVFWKSALSHLESNYQRYLNHRH